CELSLRGRPQWSPATPRDLPTAVHRTPATPDGLSRAEACTANRPARTRSGPEAPRGIRPAGFRSVAPTRWRAVGRTRGVAVTRGGRPRRVPRDSHARPPTRLTAPTRSRALQGRIKEGAEGRSSTRTFRRTRSSRAPG